MPIGDDSEMEYTTLGNTGTTVSRLCFGTWRFAKEVDGVVETDREEAHALLDACHEHGINFIDTANVYGSPSGRAEEYIGEWLETRDRDDYVIASKVFGATDDGPNSGGLARRQIRRHVEGTLDRLGTDYLDLYYIHRWDDDTPIRETLSALTDLVHEGRVHYLGASSMAAWKLTKALWTADVEGLQRFDVTQPMLHAAAREEVADYIDVCRDQDVAVCPYSPLAGGFLTGKYERTAEGDYQAPDGSRGSLYDRFDDYYVSEAGWAVLDAVRDVASEAAATPAQVALQFLAEYGRRTDFTCVPIIGARTPEQVAENAGMAGVSLTDEQYAAIDTAADGGESED